MASNSPKGKTKQRKPERTQPTVPPITFPAGMSQAEMQHIIANAIIEARKADEDAKYSGVAGGSRFKDIS